LATRVAGPSSVWGGGTPDHRRILPIRHPRTELPHL
jgi:hypothetical protein